MSLFFLRQEYRQYVAACLADNEQPDPFRHWHDTTYYYDWLDNQ